MNTKKQEKLKKVLPNFLKELRENLGLTQVNLAKRLGKPQSYVSKYEMGEKTLNLVEISVICDVFGITVTDFVKKLEKNI